MEVSNHFVLHNSNPKLVPKTLAEKNLGEKSEIAHYDPNLYSKIFEEIKKTEDKIEQDFWIEVIDEDIKEAAVNLSV